MWDLWRVSAPQKPWRESWLAAIATATVFWATPLLVLAAKQGQSDDKLPKGLVIIPKGGDDEVQTFVAKEMEPRHAVAVATAGKGTKRHLLIQELAEDKELRALLAVGIQFAGRGSSLTLHIHGGEAVPYAGKWTRGAIRSWFVSTSYPLVNRMGTQFPPQKYFSKNPFGVVLVMTDEQSEELIKALEPHAEAYRDRLKFSFFQKLAGTEKLCTDYGIWTNDELLLMENPSEEGPRAGSHSNHPTAPKYRMTGVTSTRIEQFFRNYTAGVLPRYFRSEKAQPLVSTVPGVRELSGWDFVNVVNDPSSSVLVEFTSKNCDACEEFAPAFKEVAAKVEDAKRRKNLAFSNLIIARMDQSANEHPERVRGTPWLRYWQRQRPSSRKAKRPVDVELRSVDSIWAFLEERMAEELEDLAEDGTQAAASATASTCSASGQGCATAQGDAATAATTESGGSGISLGKPSPETARGYMKTNVDPGEEDT